MVDRIAGEPWATEVGESLGRAREKGLAFIRRFDALVEAIEQAKQKEEDNPTSSYTMQKILRDRDTLDSFRNSVKKPGNVLKDKVFLELERRYL